MSKTINFETGGIYEFNAIADDRLRLSIDGISVINAMLTSGEHTYAERLNVSTGSHTFLIEIQNQTGSARLDLGWKLTSSSDIVTQIPLWSASAILPLDNTGADTSGYENNATLVSTSYIPSFLGQAITLNDLTNSRIDLPVTTLNQWKSKLATDTTISFWVKTYREAASLLSLTNSSNQTIESLFFSGNTLCQKIGTYPVECSVPNVLADGNWHNISLSFASGAGYLATFDGNPILTGSTDRLDTTNLAHVNFGYVPGRSESQGSYDNIRIYTRPLIIDELTTIAGENQDMAKTGCPAIT
jgi:hypothetical protein